METKELTLFEGSFESAPVTMSSREIASLTGKRHDNTLRDCDELNESYEKLGLPKIGQTTYKDARNRKQREYRLTRMQCFDLMTGYLLKREGVQVIPRGTWTNLWYTDI